MDRARKKIASAIDGFRTTHSRIELDVEERVASEHCILSKIVRHGFPDDPRCLAYDPVQKLVAIGAGRGVVRLLGKAGVDYLLKHDSEDAVTHVQFLVNEGGLVTVQRDEYIHLWNYRQKVPEIVHTKRMEKERVTCLYLPFQSRWLYIGTDKGNVYFVALGTFEFSSYVINWNKAIDISCRTHPGSVRQLGLCPTDPTRLLIAFEKSHASLWTIPTREAEQFAVGQPQIRCFAWHHDGKQFMCGHVDGSLTIWNLRRATEPQQKITPHSSEVLCRPITHLVWQNTNENDQFVSFVGGLTADEGATPAVTVMRGRPMSTKVFEMDTPVVAFLPLLQSPFTNAGQHAQAFAVLLKSDFIVIDPAGLHYENHYAMDIHESPVTLVSYFANCPVDLIAALTLVGRNQRKAPHAATNKPWPISGGVSRECATGHQEVLATGHEDGSIKFWQASSETLEIMYKLKTGRHFEKTDESRAVSYAVTHIELCVDSRLLLVAGACGQVTMFRFVKTESSQDIAIVLLHQLCSAVGRSVSPVAANDEEALRLAAREMRRQLETSASRDSTHSSDTSVGSDNLVEQMPLKVRGGSVRRPAGYQPELVCQIPWIDATTPERVTALALNSAYGVVAVGTAAGMALVDIVSYTQIYAWSNSDLCGRDPIPLAVQSSNSEASPSSENMHSTVGSPGLASQQSGPARSSFMRLNTEKLRSATDRRPILAKAQSIAASAAAAVMPSSLSSPGGGNGNQTVDPLSASLNAGIGALTSGNEAFCNGDSLKALPSETSRCSSSASLERLNSMPEFVTRLTFICSPSKRGQSKPEPCLWLGMSTGAVVAFVLQLPPGRITNSVIATSSDMFDGPKGSVIRLPDRIIEMAFLDRNFCLTTGACESYRDPTKDSAPTSANIERAHQNRSLTKSSMAPTVAADTPLPPPEELGQLVVIVAEHEVKVVALPAYQQVYAHRPDIPFVLARPSHVRGFPVLVCLNAASQLVVFSLPSLRPLIQQQLFKGSVDIDDAICQKTEFSEHGLGMYMASPSEVQKFTVCSDLAAQVAECEGELFVPMDMPLPPKTSFLSSIFGQKDSVDIDAILSEQPASGTGPSVRSVARTVPLTNMEAVTARNMTAGQAAAQALQNLGERGERLNATVDATENLRNNAMNLSSRTSQLAAKYEKRKWYQL